MTLFDSILSLIGLKSSDSKQQSTTDVTVEHDPDAENEAAVKGTDASASTGSLTEEPPEDEAAEPAEATGTSDHAGEDHEAAEPAEAAGPVSDEPDPETTESAPVDESPESNTPAAAETESEDESDAEESVAAESDASASTGSMTEEPPEDEAAAEPAEAVGTGSEGLDEHVTDESGDATGPVADRANPHLESKPVSEADSEDEEAEPDEDPGEDPVDTVSGIGPAYASKLGDAGIESVAELAAADPAELAEQTDISEKRLTRLVERAQEQLD